MVAVGMAATLTLASCTHIPGLQTTNNTIEIPANQSTAASSTVDMAEPSTEQMPIIDGPRLNNTGLNSTGNTNGTGTGTGTDPNQADPEDVSKWRKMLEPYLANKNTRTDNGTDNTGKLQLFPPSLPPLLPLSDGTVRVGILVPLTGQNAPLGKAMLNAAQMAMFDFADTDFELLPHDTAGLPEQASFGATMVIGDGATLLAGPLLASSVRAVAPISQAAGVPVLAFSSDREVAGNGVYTMGFLPENNTQRVITYALSKGLSRFAILAPNTAYGSAVVSAARQTIIDNGQTLNDVAFYNSSGSDIEAVVKRMANYDNRRNALIDMRRELGKNDDEISLKALERLSLLDTLGDLPFDTLLIADGGERLQNVAAMLPFFDIDPKKVRILGTGQWDVGGIGAEPALQGAWFAAPPTDTRATFVNRYVDLFGAQPPRLASMAYDAVALAAVLARTPASPETSEGESAEQAPRVSPFSAQAIMFDRGYSGRDGIFRFSPRGTADRGLAIYQVAPRENIIIDPAPKTFATAIN